MAVYFVSKEDKKDFSRIQSAIDKAMPGDTIYVRPGIYREKLRLDKNDLTLIGDKDKACVVSWDDFAEKDHEDGDKYGTFRSYTCLIQGDGVTIEQLTIENTAGSGSDIGQAIALYADGDRLTVNKCRLLGCQDTLFTGPLPKAPRIPGSFKGPSEDRPYRRQYQYYNQCRIRGDVDFIFGSAQAVFRECSMVINDRGKEVNGYVTAPSTWQGEGYGFVFIDSEFVGASNTMDGTVFLGRPWRPYGQVMLVNCHWDACMNEALWDPWGNGKNLETAVFQEDYKGNLDFLNIWHKNSLR